MCRSPTRIAREPAQISQSLRCISRSRWAEDMTNTLNYIPQNRDASCLNRLVREQCASSRETRSSGTSSFLSYTIVHDRSVTLGGLFWILRKGKRLRTLYIPPYDSSKLSKQLGYILCLWIQKNGTYKWFYKETKWIHVCTYYVTTKFIFMYLFIYLFDRRKFFVIRYLLKNRLQWLQMLLS